jgi:glycosyltransferase involved in cell wall biosynthesis
MGIGLISTYPPRMCGIATVASHLRQALVTAGEPYVPVVAMVKDPTDAAYGPEVLVPIRHHERQDYRTAALALNAAPVEVVILQHEFGIFGGHYGSYILDLLSALTKPVITVIHTVLDQPPKGLVGVARSVAGRSARVVTLSHRDRGLLCSRYGLPPDKVDVISLGVPDPPAGTPAEWKERLGLSNRTVAMTFGLLGPGKGIETAIEAVGQVAHAYPDLLYLVAGTTHPEVRRTGGETYRAGLMARAAALGISHQVQFIDRYLEEEELFRYLLASDIYITPYPQKGRGVSLTTLYAAFLGKAILSTSFDYAQELLSHGAGWLLPLTDANAMALALHVLISNPEARAGLGAVAQARTRDFSWSHIGQRYLALARALAGAPTAAVSVPSDRPALSAVIQADRPMIRARARLGTSVGLVLYNTGTADWSPEDQKITIAADLLSSGRRLLQQGIWRCPITEPVASGGTRTLTMQFLASHRPGTYLLEIYPVHQQAGRFGNPLVMKLVVTSI